MESQTVWLLLVSFLLMYGMLGCGEKSQPVVEAPSAVVDESRASVVEESQPVVERPKPGTAPKAVAVEPDVTENARSKTESSAPPPQPPDDFRSQTPLLISEDELVGVWTGKDRFGFDITLSFLKKEDVRFFLFRPLHYGGYWELLSDNTVSLGQPTGAKLIKKDVLRVFYYYGVDDGWETIYGEFSRRPHAER